jgi:rhamnosyltransferase
MSVSNCFEYMPNYPEKSRICSIIITFNPDADFNDRVSRIARQVDKTIIIDNASNKSAVKMLKDMISSLKVDLLFNSSNLGIATALNQGMNRAKEQGYNWALTFDQDTIVEDYLVEALQQTYRDIEQKDTIAIIGSNYIEVNYPNGKNYLLSQKNISWTETKTVITSGSLISITAFNNIGLFRDDLFIDLVDIEYCLRARSKGFKIYLSRRQLMQHTIGSISIHKLPWKTTGTTNHSALRRYFMIRNYIVVARQYLFSEPVWVITTLYQRIKSVMLMMFFETNRLTKLKFIILGMIDGLFNNFERRLM